MEPQISSKTAWEFEILGKWREIIEIAEAFRVNHIAQVKDHDIRNLYASKLTRLWVEVEPHVLGREDFGNDFVNEFKSYRPFYFDPGQFFEKDNEARLYELEECLRLALYKLKIA